MENSCRVSRQYAWETHFGGRINKIRRGKRGKQWQDAPARCIHTLETIGNNDQPWLRIGTHNSHELAPTAGILMPISGLTFRLEQVTRQYHDTVTWSYQVEYLDTVGWQIDGITILVLLLEGEYHGTASVGEQYHNTRPSFRKRVSWYCCDPIGWVPWYCRRTVSQYSCPPRSMTVLLLPH